MGPSVRRVASDFALDALVLAVAAAHVFRAPYAKVEESFNLQATHDVMYHGWDLSAYDHHAFPGVVPRTFIGAIALAAVARPLQAALVFLRVLDSDEARGTKMGAQIAARLALAAATVAALGRMRRVLRDAFGEAVGVAFALIVASQFHLTFYASRTLPNTFALVLTTLAAADWIDARARRAAKARGEKKKDETSSSRVDPRDARAVFLLTASCVIFRCDTALLLAAVGAHMLRARAFSLPGAVNWGARCAAACLSLTVAVDTAMWAPPSAGHPGAFFREDDRSDAREPPPFWPGAEGIMWPEGRVFWFNTYENRSHEWGTSPFHWYFTNALPRALGAWTPLVAFGAAARKEARAVFLVALSFVAAYSFLPHKELRFVFPALPLCDACAAVGAVEAHRRLAGTRERSSARTSASKKSKRANADATRFFARAHSARALPALLIGVVLLLAVAMHAVFAAAAYRNYPGGEAFAATHAAETSREAFREKPTRVHVDVAAAMTGASRFGESVFQDAFVYSKREDLTLEAFQSLPESKAFDVLLSGSDFVPGYEAEAVHEGYAGTRIVWRRLFGFVEAPVWVATRTKPAVWTHRRTATSSNERSVESARASREESSSGEREGSPRAVPDERENRNA